jgi:hypothetical protein
LAAIDFHNQATGGTEEVHDVRADRSRTCIHAVIALNPLAFECEASIRGLCYAPCNALFRLRGGDLR